MLHSTAGRWATGAVAAALIAGAIGSPLLAWRPSPAIEIPSELLSQFAYTAPEEASPVLTRIARALAAEGREPQVLLLQAVPNEPPLVVASTEDSSDDEEATHWPSPWPAVNAALASGELVEPTTVWGRRAGFDYAHRLVPVDETRSLVLLVNQAAPSPTWGARQALMLLSGVLLFVVLFATRG